MYAVRNLFALTACELCLDSEECSRQDTRSTIEPHRTSNPSNIVSLIEGIVIVSIDVRPW